MVAPILKWAGKKTRLLPEIRKRLPARFGRYYEPFAGGAALFFALAPERAVIGDANADLIALYRALANDVDDVIDLLEHIVVDHGEEHYDRVRADWNARAYDGAGDRGAHAAAMLYLNRACFNGLWRVNRRGEFNVPIGRRSDGSLNAVEVDEDNLRAAARALARAELRAGDFRDCVRDAERGDLVYFDPPYVPLTPTSSFTSYTAGAFGLAEQRALAELARDLVDRGVHVVISNSDAPLVRELYAGMQIDAVECGRSIGARSSSRTKVGEVIIVGSPDRACANS